jgi:hypothetical protein
VRSGRGGSFGDERIEAMGKPVEFMMKVKLPSPAAFPSCPSGDTDYDDAYRSAIFAEKPMGFEIAWPRLNQKWPVDSEGFTWVPLYLSSSKDALHVALNEWHRLQKAHQALLDKLKALA